MRPGIAPVEGEIVGVGHDAARRRLGMKDLVGDAMALAIGGRLLEGFEAQVHLLAHVARTGPAHQRLDLARLFGLIVEHPFLGLAGTGLHRSLRGLVDASRHVLSLALTVENAAAWSGQQDLNLRQPTEIAEYRSDNRRVLWAPSSYSSQLVLTTNEWVKGNCSIIENGRPTTGPRPFGCRSQARDATFRRCHGPTNAALQAPGNPRGHGEPNTRSNSRTPQSAQVAPRGS